jgi:hypothetical protein
MDWSLKAALHHLSFQQDFINEMAVVKVQALFPWPEYLLAWC